MGLESLGHLVQGKVEGKSLATPKMSALVAFGPSYLTNPTSLMLLLSLSLNPSWLFLPLEIPSTEAFERLAAMGGANSWVDLVN